MATQSEGSFIPRKLAGRYLISLQVVEPNARRQLCKEFNQSKDFFNAKNHDEQHFTLSGGKVKILINYKKIKLTLYQCES